MPRGEVVRLLEAWLKGFFAVSAVLGGGDRDLGRGFLVLVLALLNVLQDDGAPAGRGLLREVLAHYKCPDAIAFGPMPKTSTGKIQKFVLRQREWVGQDKRVGDV